VTDKLDHKALFEKAMKDSTKEVEYRYPKYKGAKKAKKIEETAERIYMASVSRPLGKICPFVNGECVEDSCEFWSYSGGGVTSEYECGIKLFMKIRT
jgi:hypothetical protein